MSRVFAISDLHIDFRHNREWLERLPAEHYRSDTLLLAGDLCDDLGLMEAGLARLKRTFGRVFFVPGNHDLWVRRGDWADSLEKFEAVLAACERTGAETRPARVGAGRSAAWIVPLFSWYEKPEEGPGSLFLPKPGEDPTLSMWADNVFTRWPPLSDGLSVAGHFLRRNEEHLERTFDTPVISFSHFLPRQDLMFSNPEVLADPRRLLRRLPSPDDPHPGFNFSRVAGCRGLEQQIRRLGSTVHVYGHQHRNRWRRVDGVLYVSHCLGYARERDGRRRPGLDGPRRVWPPEEGLSG